MENRMIMMTSRDPERKTAGDYI